MKTKKQVRARIRELLKKQDDCYTNEDWYRYDGEINALEWVLKSND